MPTPDSTLHPSMLKAVSKDGAAQELGRGTLTESKQPVAEAKMLRGAGLILRKLWRITGRTRIRSAAASSRSWYQGWYPTPGPAARAGCQRAAWDSGPALAVGAQGPAGRGAEGLQRSFSKLPGSLALNFAFSSQWCQS